jgi:hypothetical protein
MLSSEIVLSTGPSSVELDWVPERISKFVGQLAVLHEGPTDLVSPLPIVRDDDRTLFACSGVQIIYPQIFDGAEVPDTPQLISQPVIRTQHLPNVKEGTSTSFVNYNLIAFGMKQKDHEEITRDFFDKMVEVDMSGTDQYRVVRVEDWEQNWNGLPVMMDTNDKLWINGVELGESIYYANMQLPSGETVSVSEIAFGLERLFYATEAPLEQTSYFTAMLGGIDTIPPQKDIELAAFCDAIKSCTLMSMHGVSPSNKAQGYRMRKFIKRAVEINGIDGVDIDEAVNNAYHFWASFMPPTSDQKSVINMIKTEYARNENRQVLDRLQANHGVTIDIDINQSSADFWEQLVNTGRVPVNFV